MLISSTGFVRTGCFHRLGSVVSALALVVSVIPADAAVRGRQSRPSPVPAAAKSDPVPQGPLTIVVSVRDQRLSVFAGTDQIARVPISSGTRGHETPMGIFSVIQKNRMHYSNLYNNAPMPFMQRLTWSGIALHAGYLPGYPASHGCVRMPADFARKLFGMTKMGARVVVAQSDTAPQTMAHARLAELNSGTKLAGLSPPMHLGAGEGAPEAGASPVGAEAAGAAAPASLLRKAQEQVKERAAAVEIARTARSETATRHEEALALMATGREAVAAGRAEVAKAIAKVRRLESETQVQEARLRDLGRKPDADSAAAASVEDKIDDTLQALTADLEGARKDAADKEETLREIMEEASDLDRNRARASLDNEDTALRLKIADERLKEARRELSRRQQPISMLVSRKAGKLYVRQGFEPLLEVALSLDNPEMPVGTHVFTAHAASGGNGLQWTGMTLPTNANGNVGSKGGSGRSATIAGARRGGNVHTVEDGRTTGPLTAAAALERFQMPAEVRDQLSELMYPGSSLIISDQPLSQETGKYTDLIVLTR